MRYRLRKSSATSIREWGILPSSCGRWRLAKAERLRIEGSDSLSKRAASFSEGTNLASSVRTIQASPIVFLMLGGYYGKTVAIAFETCIRFGLPLVPNGA